MHGRILRPREFDLEGFHRHEVKSESESNNDRRRQSTNGSKKDYTSKIVTLESLIVDR